MKIYRHYAEVCPRCGAVGSMRANIPDPNHAGGYLFVGKTIAVNRERRTYVACQKCLARALRITEMPPKK